MIETHWQVQPKTGFLLQPQPVLRLTVENFPVAESSIEAITLAASNLPDWLAAQQTNALLQSLQAVDYHSIPFHQLTPLVTERLFALYGYFASAWVHGFDNSQLPAAIVLPLVALAKQVQRPPILAYAGQVLSNWALRHNEQDFTPHNILLLQTFTHLVDESWFFRVHIAIEAQAGKMLHALSTVNTAVDNANDMAVLEVLRQLQTGLVQITRTFHQMPELCDPDVYYQEVRPFLMSFEKSVVFEGVAVNPTPLRGGSGAQSSVVPALLAGLGIEHAANDLIHSLTDMRRYMPVEHRAFIQQMRELRLRDYCKSRPHLADAYNHVLRQLMTFRRAHLYYARTFIFEKSTNPVGTGGTEYMSFLSKLIDETANFML
jgi:indoleamine 2,3-dioxygenase